ncbi:MAG: DUF4351 domain-containing protein, partial [Planctomycetaceae bacterium]|nr:DUF4351 domain-containing protein [Planctomycetaceae bacterium]
ARGEARGKAEGLAEGKVKNEVRTIFRLLTRRFGNISEMIEEELVKITNFERLDQLWDIAYDCQTLEEFEDALKRGCYD